MTLPTNPTAVSLRLSLSVNNALSVVRGVVFPGLFGIGTYTDTLAPYERAYEIDEMTSLESLTITASDRVGTPTVRRIPLSETTLRPRSP
ncbi:MAG: hypothetical protein EHM70_17715 [Chloroflexota bacterium]|nr:MAG: hypothetical protein EHM70_17715 [Chloroflexota bacterium]